MPGPGTARDQPAAAQLRAGLAGWRRRIARRRSAAEARRWALITLGTSLAGVAAGRFDGSMLVSAFAAAALALGAGVVSVVRARRVCAADAARELDAAFGFDEQVATAWCCAQVGTAAAGRTTDRDRLVAELIERAAILVERTRVVQGPRPVPAYGEWAAMAVTAAAIAAVATVPGSHQATLSTAAAGPVRATAAPLPGATAAPRPTLASGVIHGNGGSRDAAATSGQGTAPPMRSAAESAAAGGTQPAVSRAGTSTAMATGGAAGAAAEAGAEASPAKAGSGEGGAPASPAKAGSGEGGAPAATAKAGSAAGEAPASPGTAGARAAGGQAVAAPSGGPGQRGLVRSVAGKAATVPHAAGTRSFAAHHGGVPGGDAAGTLPGDDRTSARPLPLPSAGGAVLVIVLPGGDGAVAVPTGQGAPGQQPEDGGATATPSVTAMAQGSAAQYVPPDQNEVPFPYLDVLGRYF